VQSKRRVDQRADEPIEHHDGFYRFASCLSNLRLMGSLLAPRH
jgi:hypothetical protein